jgi:RimJ/RimL family protein N-acetyltransferase
MNKLLIDIPEVIETPRLKLQMPKAGFGQKVHAAISDGYEDYIKWLHWPKAIPSIEMLEAECRQNHADFILRELIRYLILDKQTEEIVGRCAFPPVQTNWTIPQFGISYFIRGSQRAKGYGTEATHAMALLAFRRLNAKKVEIYCDSDNLPSTKIPQKLGFQLEYTQKGGWLRQDGKLAELQTYSTFSEQSLPHLEVAWD